MVFAIGIVALTCFASRMRFPVNAAESADFQMLRRYRWSRCALFDRLGEYVVLAWAHGVVP